MVCKEPYPESNGRTPEYPTQAPLAGWYPVAFDKEVRCSRHITRRVHGDTIEINRDQPGRVAIRSTATDEIWGARSALGLIWGCAKPGASPLPSIFAGSDLSVRHLIAGSEVLARADFDQAVLGLVDPAHVPVVHNAWWWRSPERRRVKAKSYSPSPYGFTARAEDKKASAIAYRVFGSEVDISIEFRLPSIRIEHTRGSRGQLLNLTSITPVGPREVVLRNLLYTDLLLIRPIGPFLAFLGRQFLRQDVEILEMMDIEYLARRRMLFVGDPDMPSRWYFQCKDALRHAQESGTEYVNPISPRTLKWFT